MNFSPSFQFFYFFSVILFAFTMFDLLIITVSKENLSLLKKNAMNQISFYVRTHKQRAA